MGYKKKQINVILNDAQRNFIDSNWAILRLPDLIKGTFNDQTLDGRCAQSRAVKDYLGDREPLPTSYIKMDDLGLSDEQKEYITSNVGKGSSARAWLTTHRRMADCSGSRRGMRKAHIGAFTRLALPAFNPSPRMPRFAKP